jgi:acyl-coenzyme A thioesterase PaaI-like protein
MFQYTLNTDRGIRAFLSFRRWGKEPDSIFPWENCFLISIGDGVDGATGRAHGGFNSLVLDHVCGHCASHALENDPNPATATLTTDYKAPISTPCVVFARAWVIELSGRKVWVRAVIEDGDGKILAAGKALFIATKKTKL